MHPFPGADSLAAVDQRRSTSGEFADSDLGKAGILSALLLIPLVSSLVAAIL